MKNTDAKRLAGTVWRIEGIAYQFRDYDPGDPHWRSGAEGKAFPLKDSASAIRAYFKSFNNTTSRRKERTQWLADQQLDQLSPCLRAAPRLWVDTQRVGRPGGATFDCEGYLADAVPGRTWYECKDELASERITLNLDTRLRLVLDLVGALALLEKRGLVHGDVSPMNVVVDLTTKPRASMLYLIDFDAYAVDGARRQATWLTGHVNGHLTVKEGGTFGTEGYCPKDLESRHESRDTSIAPYSDRCARDMLLLEFLGFGREFAKHRAESPRNWPRPDQRRLDILWRTSLAGLRGADAALAHMTFPDVFRMPEAQRPTSVALAQALGVPVAVSRDRPAPKRETQVPSPAAVRPVAAPPLQWPTAKTTIGSGRPTVVPFAPSHKGVTRVSRARSYSVATGAVLACLGVVGSFLFPKAPEQQAGANLPSQSSVADETPHPVGMNGGTLPPETTTASFRPRQSTPQKRATEVSVVTGPAPTNVRSRPPVRENHIPTAFVSARLPPAPAAAEPFTLILSGDDTDGEPLTFEYRTGSATEWVSALESRITVPYLRPGDTRIEYRARDPQGATSAPMTETVTVPFPNRPPSVRIARAQPVDPHVGDHFEVEVEANDPDAGDKIRVECRVITLTKQGEWHELEGRTVMLRNLALGPLRVEARAVDSRLRCVVSPLPLVDCTTAFPANADGTQSGPRSATEGAPDTPAAPTSATDAAFRRARMGDQESRRAANDHYYLRTRP